MSSYPFYYEAVIMDIDDSCNYLSETGMGLAASFTDAMHIIEERYGTDLIMITHLELCEDDSVIILPKSVCESYIKNDFKEPTLIHYKEK